MRFARMELEHVLPTIVAAADVDPVGRLELTVDPGVTLQPAESIPAVVRAR